MPETFTCAECHGVFPTVPGADEKAVAEYKKNFPEVAHAPEEKIDVVCNDCYRRFMRWFESLPASERDAMKADAVEDLKSP